MMLAIGGGGGLYCSRIEVQPVRLQWCIGGRALAANVVCMFAPRASFGNGSLHWNRGLLMRNAFVQEAELVGSILSTAAHLD